MGFYIGSKRFKLNNGKRIKLIAKKRNNQAVQNTLILISVVPPPTEREKKVLKKGFQLKWH